MANVLSGLPKIMASALKSVTSPLTIERKSGAFSPSTGAVTATTATYAVQGIVTEYAESYRLRGLVEADERKAIILQSGAETTPALNDVLIDAAGTRLTVAAVSQDPAAATWELRVKA